jgi:hypothetical protein
MTGPISSGISSAPTTLFAASPVTKMTTSVSGGGVTVVPSHQHQFHQPQTVQLTIPSVTKSFFELPSANGSGVTVNLTTSHHAEDDMESSHDFDQVKILSNALFSFAADSPPK